MSRKWNAKLRDASSRLTALIKKAIRWIKDIFVRYKNDNLRNVIFEFSDALKKIYNNSIDESIFRFFDFENVDPVDWDTLMTSDHINRIREFYEALADDKAIYFATTVDWEQIKDNVAYLNHKSQIIGWTETHSSLQSTDFATAKKLGYTHKTWRTLGDDHVRLSHARQNKMTIPINDTFPNGLLYAGDTSTGEADEFVNCRCFLKFSKKTT